MESMVNDSIKIKRCLLSMVVLKEQMENNLSFMKEFSPLDQQELFSVSAAPSFIYWEIRVRNRLSTGWP